MKSFGRDWNWLSGWKLDCFEGVGLVRGVEEEGDTRDEGVLS